MKDYPIHPACDLIPEMTPDEYADLKESIGRHGVKDPVTLCDGQVLDGRNRYRATKDLRLPCPTVEYTGKKDMVSLLEFVLMRTKRRNLTTSQRAMLANEVRSQIEQLRGDDDGPRRKAADKGEGQSSHSSRATESAAKLAGVSERSMARAKQVQEQSPKLAEKVVKGEISLGAAEKALKKDDAASTKGAHVAPTVTDANGNDVPDKLVSVFESAVLAELAADVRAIRKRVKEIRSERIGTYIHEQTEVDLSNVANAIQFAKPFALCAYCLPTGLKGCKACRKSGFMTKDVFNAVPKEARG